MGLNNKLKVILISGKAQSGKDTFANYFKRIANANQKKVLIIKYADILKFVCKEYYDWNGIKDDYGRSLSQKIGTDLCRSNNPDVWVNCVIEIVKSLSTEYDYILIPDTRFPNEILKWNETGIDYMTVRINRVDKDFNDFDNKLSDEQKNHISETALDDWMFEYNFYNQDINSLFDSIDVLFEVLERDVKN